jgi:HAE1 family hydrophobic/amphiphilic exporter-1
LLKPKAKDGSRGPLGRFFAWFNGFFARTTESYVSTSGRLIHKSGFAMLGLLAIAVVAVLLGGRLPTGFLPQEDQGYLYAAIQLPDAASLQRTDAAAQKVTAALMQTPGVQSVVGVNGFSLLTLTESTNTGFFFVTLKPWDERKSRAEQIQAIQTGMQQKLAGLRVPAAGHSRHRHRRWRDDDSSGPLRQRRSDLFDEERLRLSCRRIETSRDCRRHPVLFACRPPALRGG